MSLLKRAATVFQRAPVSTAETVYLTGPGTLRVRGKLPYWESLQGSSQKLQPHYLKRLIVLGYADISGAAFGLLWRHRVEVVFLSPHANSILARVSPGETPANLTRKQWSCCQDMGFVLQRGRELVVAKAESTRQASRYYQQQGKNAFVDDIHTATHRIESRLEKSRDLNVIRGLEGSIAAAWWRRFASMLDSSWDFSHRRCHPSPDPINAMLSLGYTVLQTRAQTLLSAAGLDVSQGFLHAPRAGRASLACDLIEPFRIPLVDRAVLRLVNQRLITPRDFEFPAKNECRIASDAKKLLIQQIEESLATSCRGDSPTIHQCIDRWTEQIRNHAARDDAIDAEL